MRQAPFTKKSMKWNLTAQQSPRTLLLSEISLSNISPIMASNGGAPASLPLPYLHSLLYIIFTFLYNFYGCGDGDGADSWRHRNQSGEDQAPVGLQFGKKLVAGSASEAIRNGIICLFFREICFQFCWLKLFFLQLGFNMGVLFYFLVLIGSMKLLMRH